MRRLFYRGLLADTIEITGEDAHHLMHVMRAKPGQEVTVVDDAGQAARMAMTAFSATAVTLTLIERLDADTEPPIDITLAPCLLKGDKMEFVVQKAVELGATRVVPLKSQNCVVRYEAKKAAQRQQRGQKIADEACKQCGRTSLIEVAPIAELQAFVSTVPEGACLLFCYENETQQGIKRVLRQAAAMGVQTFILLIGPEGGFTLAEAAAIEQAGGHSVTLGPRILRAETAAVAALTVVQYENGDLGSNDQRSW